MAFGSQLYIIIFNNVFVARIFKAVTSCNASVGTNTQRDFCFGGDGGTSFC